jgi:hypothetical protein
MTDRLTGRVTPFGNPGISGCVLLPPAYRSLPRPSSYSSSKASTMDPFSLDHISNRFPSMLNDQPSFVPFGPVIRPRAQASLRTFARAGLSRLPQPLGRRTPSSPRTASRLSGHRLSVPFTLPLSMSKNNRSWRYGDLNPRPMACKATALATELYPLVDARARRRDMRNREERVCVLPCGKPRGSRFTFERRIGCVFRRVRRAGPKPFALPPPPPRSRGMTLAAGAMRFRAGTVIS